MSLLRRDFPCAGGVSLLFDQPVSLLTEMRNAIGLLTSLAAEQLRRDRLLTRKVTVWLETERQSSTVPELRSLSTDLPVPVGDVRLLSVFTHGSVDELYQPGHRYRAAGVYCEDFAADESAMASLLDKPGGRVARPYGPVNRIVTRQVLAASKPILSCRA